MKTKISMFIALILGATVVTYAQQGGYQRMSTEDRVKNVMDKLTGPLNLDTAQQSKTAAIFTDFYNAQTKMREDAMASGQRPDRDAFQKLMSDRDDKLKGVFTDDQYKKYKDEVEPTLRPQRRGGGGFGNN
jgi:periplasmic protein CpxP/Spy